MRSRKQGEILPSHWEKIDNKFFVKKKQTQTTTK